MKYLVQVGVRNSLTEIKPKFVQVIDMPDNYDIEADAVKLDDLGEPFIELRNSFMKVIRQRPETEFNRVVYRDGRRYTVLSISPIKN